jgi:DNA polymerase
MHIHIDFETRSVVDIQKAGADVYAEHPSTEVLCLCYAFGDDDVRLWTPGAILPPDDLLRALENPENKAVAHNAYFELVIWNKVCRERYGFPELRPEQVIDTMAIAYAHALPGSLAGVGRAIGLKQQKDDVGRRVMLKLCRPKGYDNLGNPIWIEPEDDPEAFDILYRYCANDVVVEREVERKLPALKASEQDAWVLDFIVNQRGVPIDVASVRAAKRVIEEEARALNKELRQITGGTVPAASNPGKIVTWLREVKGLDVHSLTKADVRELMGRPDLSADARRVLEIRQQVGRSSVKKLDAMLACVSDDGRARGLHQFHAASTGRWGGRRIQTQNMYRPEKGVDVNWCFDMLSRQGAYEAIRIVHGSVTPAVASCMRGMIATKGDRRFVVSDFSNVEGRVLPWLAGEDWKLDLFRAIDRGEGKDIYLVSASAIYGEEIDDKEDPRRQHGKVSELALGYQGGPGAFASMAANYAVVVEDILPFVWPVSSEERREAAIRSWETMGKARNVMSRDAWIAAELIKIPWREKHPMTVQYWRDIEDAAIAAVEQPGRITKVGFGVSQVRFRVAGSFLFMRLPSGRCLAYPYPKLVWRKMPWKDERTGKQASKLVLTYFSRIDESKKPKIVPDPHNESKWARVATYGGELTENADQAVSRDLLKDAKRRAEDRGYEIVMHVHDELVAELPHGQGALAELNEIMAELPPWAAGLPMASAGWEGSRYRK